MDCSKGKYSTNNAGVNEDSCISCEPGKYHSANGRGYGCTDCGLGEIGNLPLSATSCIKCSSGFYNDEHRQIKCKGCAAGKYTNMYCYFLLQNEKLGFDEKIGKVTICVH